LILKAPTTVGSAVRLVLAVARTSSAVAWVVWTAARVVLAVHWLVLTAKTIVSAAATSPAKAAKAPKTSENAWKLLNNQQMAGLTSQRLPETTR